MTIAHCIKFTEKEKHVSPYTVWNRHARQQGRVSPTCTSNSYLGRREEPTVAK